MEQELAYAKNAKNMFFSTETRILTPNRQHYMGLDIFKCPTNIVIVGGSRRAGLCRPKAVQLLAGQYMIISTRCFGMACYPFIHIL